MNNQNLEKPTKSLLWIVATIWANIIIVFLLISVASLFLRSLLIQLLGLGSRLVGIFMILVVIGATIYAIRLGVKTVAKKSVIKKEKIFKISFGVGLVYLFFTTGLLFLLYVLLPSRIFLPYGGLLPAMREIDTIKILLISWGFNFLISFGCFGLTYYWCKKLIK